MGEIVERIPHKSVSYAFLEIRANSGNEFEALRADALKRAPHYSFAAEAPAEPRTIPVQLDRNVTGADEGQSPDGAAPNSNSTVAEPAPVTPTEGLSPREKARQKLAAKKGV